MMHKLHEHSLENTRAASHIHIYPAAIDVVARGLAILRVDFQARVPMLRETTVYKSNVSSRQLLPDKVPRDVRSSPRLVLRGKEVFDVRRKRKIETSLHIVVAITKCAA